tara:strand:- start:221 stop:706 length:486 start_codon:yes stop_codon:yes gene_type:complete
MKSLIAFIGISSLLLAPITIQAKPELDDTVISHLAMMRCWVKTGFAVRGFTHAYTEMEIQKYKKLGAKYRHNVQQMEQALNAQRNGTSKKDYERILDNWQSKDCNNALVSSIAVYFPENTSTNFIMILMAEGFFDDDFKKLSAPIYELCDKPEYQGWCSSK